MKYEGQICRAPMERGAYMLPVMVGCSYGRCRFCNLFRHLKYRELPLEDIRADLKRVKEAGGHPKRVFLGDGNAFGLKTEKLIAILDLIHSFFPDVEEINMDATITAIKHKSDEELKRLRDKKVCHLYIGIESALDDVLAFMEKDHNNTEALKEITRLKTFGYIYDAHIMTGVAGTGRGQENAEALAAWINKTRPAHVVNFSMFLHREVPLYQDMEEGKFAPASEYETLSEERELINRINVPIRYEGFHDYIAFRVRGHLPEEKEKMLSKMDKAILHYKDRRPVYAFVKGECPNLIKCESDEEIWNMENIIEWKRKL